MRVPACAGGNALVVQFTPTLMCFCKSKPRRSYPAWMTGLDPSGSRRRSQRVPASRDGFSSCFCIFDRTLVHLHPRRIQEPKQWRLSDKSPLCSVKPAAFKLHHCIQKGPRPFKAATIDLIIVRWRRWRRKFGGKSGSSPRRQTHCICQRSV